MIGGRLCPFADSDKSRVFLLLKPSLPSGGVWALGGDTP
jgi:hypothetical protein